MSGRPVTWGRINRFTGEANEENTYWNFGGGGTGRCLVRAGGRVSDIDVSGTTVSCNTVDARRQRGGSAPIVLNGNTVTFVGAINGVDFTDVLLAGGEGTGAARAGVAEFNAENTSGAARTVTVSFAVNNFTLPTGNPVAFNATQGLDNVVRRPGCDGEFHWVGQSGQHPPGWSG